jgi:hypothetical protein
MAMSPAANVVPAFLIDSDRPVDASLVSRYSATTLRLAFPRKGHEVAGFLRELLCFVVLCGAKCNGRHAD